MLRIKEFGNKVYDTYLIGYNEKYRCLFLKSNTRFVIYSLSLEKVIVETKELRRVDSLTFTSDWDYAICSAFKTNNSQLAKVYVIDMNQLSEKFVYEYIGFSAGNKTWKLSRFPSGVILARNNSIEVYDCRTKTVLLKIKNRYHTYKCLFLNEGEQEDILEITYIGNDDHDFYGVNSTAIQHYPEMKKYDKRYTAWKRYELNRKIVQSRTPTGGVRIEDQLNQRNILLEKEKINFWEGKFSLSGDYFWTEIIRELDEDERIPIAVKRNRLVADAMKKIKSETELVSKDPRWLRSIQSSNEDPEDENDSFIIDSVRYSILINLKTQKVVSIMNSEEFEVWGAYSFGYDEQSGLIFFDEPMKYYDVSIVQLEDSDLINQSLADLDFRNLQLTKYANEEFCESILFKGH